LAQAQKIINDTRETGAHVISWKPGHSPDGPAKVKSTSATTFLTGENSDYWQVDGMELFVVMNLSPGELNQPW